MKLPHPPTPFLKGTHDHFTHMNFYHKWIHIPNSPILSTFTKIKLQLLTPTSSNIIYLVTRQHPLYQTTAVSLAAIGQQSEFQILTKCFHYTNKIPKSCRSLKQNSQIHYSLTKHSQPKIEWPNHLTNNQTTNA